jgi:hypothetical protein
MRRLIAFCAASLFAVSAASGQTDPKNATCPADLNWSNYPAMKFTPQKKEGRTVLYAEGAIDNGMVARLQAALEKNKPVDEIWLRSPGGNAEVGNQAGLIIRKAGIPTHIPNGWACFSACNFVFMGGPIRSVEPGGLFVVHMFTFTADGGVIAAEAQRGYKEAVSTIADVEQGSAMLASEDNDFLIRMGVSRKLLTEIMYRQKAVAVSGGDQSTRRCLTQDELFKYNVANLH